MQDCIFCKIHAGEAPSRKLGENETMFAIQDIKPHAPFHALIIPKKHVASLNDLSAEDRKKILPSMYDLAEELAVKNGIKERGYRCVINNQSEGGQVVFHLHMHMLGGASLKDNYF